MVKYVTLEKIWKSPTSDVLDILKEYEPNTFSNSTFSDSYLKMYLAKMYHHYKIINPSQNYIIEDNNFESIFGNSNDLYQAFKDCNIKFTLQYVWDMKPEQTDLIITQETTPEYVKSSVVVFLYNNFLFNLDDSKYIEDINFSNNMVSLSLLENITNVYESLDQLNRDNDIPETRMDIISQQNKEYQKMIDEQKNKDKQNEEENNKKIELQKIIDNKINEEQKYEEEKNDPILRKMRIRDSWINK